VNTVPAVAPGQPQAVQPAQHVPPGQLRKQQVHASKDDRVAPGLATREQAPGNRSNETPHAKPHAKQEQRAQPKQELQTQSSHEQKQHEKHERHEKQHEKHEKQPSGNQSRKQPASDQLDKQEQDLPADKSNKQGKK
jgi:hypothetical protein